MLCVNTGTTTANFRIDGRPGQSRRYAVRPGEQVEIPDGYCKPYVSAARKPMKPIIEQLAPSMKPLPGQYAPGMSPEAHELRNPSDAAAQVDRLVAMVQALTAEVQTLKGRQPAAPSAPVVPPPSSGDEGDQGAADELDTEDDPEGEVDEGQSGEVADEGHDDHRMTALLAESKATLLGLARELGAEAADKMTKAQLAEAILAKQDEPGDE